MQGIATLPYDIQAQPLVPVGGVETMQSAARMLADFGREGDTYIVHAAEGETVIPLEVLEANPRMKSMIYQQMHDMGLEPERYIVGNELNSIDPITGQPEFFFKKLFKKIKNVVKKVAPVVLPIALSFALGPIYGAAAGSGISTLLQGGSLKDAAKSALISGAIGGVTAGITGPARGEGAFLANVKSAATNPLDYAKAMRANMFGTGSTAAKGETAQAIQPTAATADTVQVLDTAGKPFSTSPLDSVMDVAASPKVGIETVTKPPSVFEKYVSDPFKEFVYNPADNVVGADGTISGEGTLESIFSPSRASISPEATIAEINKKAADKLALAANPAQEAAIQKAIDKRIAETAVKGAPGLLKQFTPLALAGTGIAGVAAASGLGGFSDTDNDGVDDSTGLTLNEYKLQYPDRFFGPGFYGDNPYYQDSRFLTPEAVLAARGGEIKGPGTPTSDSIPAMLSDGEFVMNAKAVRGAGGGNRKAGAKRMYDMMRKFERMA